MSSEGDCLKLLVLGDGGVGKTCLLITHTTNKYPEEYIPTVFDNYAIDVTHRGRKYQLGLWDTAGGEDYPRLRPLSYPQTDVFMICFDVANRYTFDTIKEYWYPELDYHCPDPPRLIVGCKTDLRHCPITSSRKSIVTYKEGLALAKSLNARYCETSSLKHEGLRECFEQAVDLGVWNLEDINRFKTFFPGNSSKKRGPPIIPPFLPPAEKKPGIEIAQSTFGDEWYATLQDSKFYDVTFIAEGERHFHAHKIMLCAASSFFNNVLSNSSKSCQAQKTSSFNGFSKEDLNFGKVRGIQAVYNKEQPDSKATIVVIELSAEIQSERFVKILEFIYTGSPKLPDDAPETEWDELRKVANIFNLSELSQMCTNVINNEEEYLNQSIVTVLNGNTGMEMKRIFFNQESAQPDVVFNVEGTKMYAHKVVLSTRCQVMAAMFSGRFIEGVTLSEINIEEVTAENFLMLLEYLYSDQAPMEHISDIIGLLALADEKGVQRLVNLCELHISKEVETTCGEDKQIENADIDLIGLIHTARIFNAKQMVEWCLRFISTNYIPFSNRSDFSNLAEADREYVEQNRWPPLSYLQEMEEYERKVAERCRRKKAKGCSVM